MQARTALAGRLRSELGWTVDLPEQGESVDLG
jgi:hypothetical protein